MGDRNRVRVVVKVDFCSKFGLVDIVVGGVRLDWPRLVLYRFVVRGSRVGLRRLTVVGEGRRMDCARQVTG